MGIVKDISNANKFSLASYFFVALTFLWPGVATLVVFQIDFFRTVEFYKLILVLISLVAPFFFLNILCLFLSINLKSDFSDEDTSVVFYFTLSSIFTSIGFLVAIAISYVISLFIGFRILYLLIILGVYEVLLFILGGYLHNQIALLKSHRFADDSMDLIPNMSEGELKKVLTEAEKFGIDTSSIPFEAKILGAKIYTSNDRKLKVKYRYNTKEYVAVIFN